MITLIQFSKMVVIQYRKFLAPLKIDRFLAKLSQLSKIINIHCSKNILISRWYKLRIKLRNYFFIQFKNFITKQAFK